MQTAYRPKRMCCINLCKVQVDSLIFNPRRTFLKVCLGKRSYKGWIIRPLTSFFHRYFICRTSVNKSKVDVRKLENNFPYWPVFKRSGKEQFRELMEAFKPKQDSVVHVHRNVDLWNTYIQFCSGHKSLSLYYHDRVCISSFTLCIYYWFYKCKHWYWHCMLHHWNIHMHSNVFRKKPKKIGITAINMSNFTFLEWF